VREVLLHLRNKGAALSVATGNLERIGRQKLTAANLLELFHLGAWSDSFEQRADIFCHAIEQVRRATRPDAAILAIGDTPADILAARANRLPVIAVATGAYTFEQLKSEEPSLCLHTFAELFAGPS
jgi:phosphoglycolate phosphatase